MITTATYIIKAVVGGDPYLFQYEHCYDAWTALEQFWHEDYADKLDKLPDCDMFPIEILSMLEGKVICTMTAMFNCAVFHAFFDKGHTIDGVYTLDQFSKDIERKDKAKNDVTSFFYYMWNRWSEEECKQVFKGDYYPHYWNKWCEAYDTMHGPRGAAELFYIMLSDTNRDKLVARALELYDGMSEKD